MRPGRGVDTNGGDDESRAAVMGYNVVVVV